MPHLRGDNTLVGSTKVRKISTTIDLALFLHAVACVLPEMACSSYPSISLLIEHDDNWLFGAR